MRCVCEILLLLIYVHACDECLLNVWTVIRVCIFCGENIWGATATPTPLSTLAVTGRFQFSPDNAEVDHLSEASQGDTNTPDVAQVYPVDTTTPVN